VLALLISVLSTTHPSVSGQFRPYFKPRSR
jgi:hypothetical protein